MPEHDITEYVAVATWDDLDTCARKIVEFWDQLPRRQEPSRTRYGRAVGKPGPRRATSTATAAGPPS